MNKRSGFKVMARLIGLVKPLTGYMLLAIFMGLIGHLCAAFITIFGGYAVLEALHFDTPFTLTALFVCVVVFAVVRGFLRYAEQACNHFIAFKLLALIRDKVFRALRRLGRLLSRSAAGKRAGRAGNGRLFGILHQSAHLRPLQQRAMAGRIRAHESAVSGFRFR